jgi:pimeloyl-ACP methyl ester carboxylesterase
MRNGDRRTRPRPPRVQESRTTSLPLKLKLTPTVTRDGWERRFCETCGLFSYYNILCQTACGLSPTYLLWGAQEVYGDEAVARRTAAALPDAELEIIEGGHLIWLDAPDYAADLVRKHVRG